MSTDENNLPVCRKLLNELGPFLTVPATRLGSRTCAKMNQNIIIGGSNLWAIAISSDETVRDSRVVTRVEIPKPSPFQGRHPKHEDLQGRGPTNP